MVNIYGEDTKLHRIQTLNAVKALVNIKQRKQVLEGAIQNEDLVKMLEEIPGTKIQILNGEQVDDIESALQKVGVSNMDYKSYLDSQGKSHVMDILKQDLMKQ